MKEQVEKSLARVREMLAVDGGSVELVEITPEGVVKVRLTGACGCCPMSQMTLKMGVERMLKEDVPQVKEVISV